MDMRVDNIPPAAQRVTARLKQIACASKGWTLVYFDANFGPGGDPAVAAEYNRVAANYAYAIAVEEGL